MQQFIYQDCPLETRVQLMDENCAAVENITYMRHLTEAEIESESKELASAVTERQRLEDEKSAVAKQYNEQITALKQKAEGHSKVLLSGEK